MPPAEAEQRYYAQWQETAFSRLIQTKQPQTVRAWRRRCLACRALALVVTRLDRLAQSTATG